MLNLKWNAGQLFSISFVEYNFGGKSTEFIADLVVGCGNLCIEVKFVEILPAFVPTKGPNSHSGLKSGEKIQHAEKVLETLSHALERLIRSMPTNAIVGLTYG